MKNVMPVTRVACLLLMLTVAVLPVRAQESEAEPFDEMEFETSKRIHEEYLQRIAENNITPAIMRGEWAVGQERRAKLGSSRGLAAGTWEFLGPRNQGGRMTGVGVSPTDPALWYSAADGGGIWKSTNSGGTWIPLTDTLPSLRMASLAVSPRDGALVLGGTHEGLMYRTSNGGATWDVIAVEPNPGWVYDIQFDPINANVLMFAAYNGLYRSTDGGFTWKVVRDGGKVSRVAFHPTTPGLVFCGQGAGSNSYIWRSTDGGDTWSESLRRQTYNGTVGVRICRSQPQVMYALFDYEEKYYRSINGGETWNVLPSQPLRDSYLRGFYVFEVDPNYPDVVFAGTTSLFRTTNGGVSWEAGDTVNKDLHVDQHAILFPASMPGHMVVGNDGGVFTSSTYTEPVITWADRNRDLVTLQIYNCTMHPNSIDTIIVGCQDNGYDKYTGNQYNWLIVGGDGFCTIYDRDDPRYFYHEYVYQNLHRANNGFTWWSDKKMRGLSTDNSSGGFYTGITSPERADWFGQGITMSAGDPKTLYMGTNFLYKTTDRAENWARVSEQEYGTGGDYITSVVTAPSSPSTIYLGTTNGRAYRVVDDGSAAVTDITPGGSFNGRVRSIAVSPQDPMLLYAGGDGGYSLRGVRRSTDGGATWAMRSTGLPRAGVNRLMFDPDYSNTLYCGTTVGLYFTRDGGDNWYPVPDVPNVEVWDFAFDRPTRTMLLGTYGRGAIRMQGFAPPEVPVSGVGGNRPLAGGDLRVMQHYGDEGFTVTLATVQGGPVAVRVFDALGRLVATLHDDHLGAGSHEFSLAAGTYILSSGTYFVEARGEHLHQVRACIVTR